MPAMPTYLFRLLSIPADPTGWRLSLLACRRYNGADQNDLLVLEPMNFQFAGRQRRNRRQVATWIAE